MSYLCVTTLIAATGDVGVFVSCVFIARPGNNNWLLFITSPRTVLEARGCRSHLHATANHSLLLSFSFFLLFSTALATRRGHGDS